MKRKDGSLIVMNRNGELAIADENGRERERYALVYGAKLNVREGQKIEAGTQLAEWELGGLRVPPALAQEVREATLAFAPLSCC